MTVGERIRQRREELHISQEELARRVGYKSRSSINKIELSRELPLHKVKPIAVALSITPGELMGWVDDDLEQEQATILYELYKQATPEIRRAVDTLLRQSMS